MIRPLGNNLIRVKKYDRLPDKFLDKFSPEIIKALKDVTPVGESNRHGKRMRDSWKIERRRRNLIITNEQPYAAFVEYGVGKRIHPVRRAYMKFFYGGKYIYAKSVRGQRPQRLMQRAIRRLQTAPRIAAKKAVLSI